MFFFYYFEVSDLDSYPKHTLEIVIWIFDTFDNNLEIKNYFKERKNLIISQNILGGVGSVLMNNFPNYAIASTHKCVRESLKIVIWIY